MSLLYVSDDLIITEPTLPKHKLSHGLRRTGVCDESETLLCPATRHVEEASRCFNGLFSRGFSAEEVFILEEKAPSLLVIHDDHHPVEFKTLHALMRVKMSLAAEIGREWLNL